MGPTSSLRLLPGHRSQGPTYSTTTRDCKSMVRTFTSLRGLAGGGCWIPGLAKQKQLEQTPQAFS